MSQKNEKPVLASSPTRSLRRRILFPFLVLILAVGLSGLLAADTLIRRYGIEQVQARQSDHLRQARMLLSRDAESLFAGADRRGADYLLHFTPQEARRLDHPLIRSSLAGTGSEGLRLLPRDGLSALGLDPADYPPLAIRPDPAADPSREESLTDLLVQEAVRPVYDASGRLQSLLLAGRVLTGNHPLVDRLRDDVFGHSGQGQTRGTVTLFQRDVRVATNVPDGRGGQATGTLVSPAVRRAVLDEGQVWTDRAFVVNDWYLTAYQPLRDMDGQIIGMLYVGLPEAPYRQAAQRFLLRYSIALLAALGIATLVALRLAASISEPLNELGQAARRIGDGQLERGIPAASPVRELEDLAHSLDEMTRRLAERETRLQETNRSYIDLIGFVSHELKGILASTMLNACTIRDGYLGLVNFKQRKALDSITRNLDYLNATVRNFLNLSRMEKDTLRIERRPMELVRGALHPSIDALARLAESRGMTLELDSPEEVRIDADEDLLRIVINNLLSNAIKYGAPRARIRLSVREYPGGVEVEVFNEGRPLAAEQIASLFGKFRRLDTPETKRAKGTGLGLFVTREIIRRHGGGIRVEAREDGNAFIFNLERGQQDDTDGNDSEETIPGDSPDSGTGLSLQPAGIRRHGHL